MRRGRSTAPERPRVVLPIPGALAVHWFLAGVAVTLAAGVAVGLI